VPRGGEVTPKRVKCRRAWGQLYIALALAALSTTLPAERAGAVRKKEDKSEKREGVNAVVKMHHPARPDRRDALQPLVSLPHSLFLSLFRDLTSPRRASLAPRENYRSP